MAEIRSLARVSGIKGLRCRQLLWPGIPSCTDTFLSRLGGIVGVSSQPFETLPPQPQV
jgi:hypothetical protein